jgi:predicted DsbA family dithiol-disulfide isomerase
VCNHHCMSAPIQVTHFTDPGCPWAYSANPFLTKLQWRFGAQLDWTLVTIGLADDAQRYLDRGYSPTKSAQGYLRFRRLGMPLATQPKPRVSATGPACRLIVATRLAAPAHEEAVFRALQAENFTTDRPLDSEELMAAALARVPEVDAAALLASLDDPAVVAAYEADKRLARTAEGGPTQAQGKSANTDGLERFTAPSLVFTRTSDGFSLEAGGFQPMEAYDVVLANLAPELERRPVPADPVEVVEAFAHPLATREIAAVMAEHLADADDAATEALLIAAAGEGRVWREGAGNDAFWHLGAAPAGGTAAWRDAGSLARA